MLGGAVATPQYDGKFYGVPWILDTKYLFFNAAHLARRRSTRASSTPGTACSTRPAP